MKPLRYTLYDSEFGILLFGPEGPRPPGWAVIDHLGCEVSCRSKMADLAWMDAYHRTPYLFPNGVEDFKLAATKAGYTIEYREEPLPTKGIASENPAP